MQTTSLTLLHRMCQIGEPDAWDRFVRLYSIGIYSWARRQGFQHEDAADIVQDVLVTLMQKLPVFEHEGPKSFRGWLWAITRNKCRERARRKKPEQFAEGQFDLLTGRNDDSFSEEEFRRHLVNQIATVIKADYPPEVWQAFWEHAVEKQPASAVAEKLGINMWAVYTAKARIVARMNEEFADLVAD